MASSQVKEFFRGRTAPSSEAQQKIFMQALMTYMTTPSDVKLEPIYMKWEDIKRCTLKIPDKFIDVEARDSFIDEMDILTKGHAERDS